MVRTFDKIFPKEAEGIDMRVTEDAQPYDPSKWLTKQIEKKGLDSNTVTTFQRKKSFNAICELVRKHLDTSNESGIQSEEQKRKDAERLELQHKAVIGDQAAMNYFVAQINEVLRKINVTSGDFPGFYDSLGEAIFHEVWGVSVLHKWEIYPQSEAAVIRGRELWIDIDGDFVKQEEEFGDDDVVQRVKRTFTLRTKDAVINEQSPELEIEREDGSRITMIQQPRSRQDYIMFRRFIVKDISLVEQSRKKTIKEEDVPLFRALSRTMPNTIFAGRVRSAKSTFMKSMLRERDSSYVIAGIEKHFELGLTSQLPDRLCFEVQAKEGDLHEAMPRLLRMEHDFIVVGEIRSLETEGYMQACERGERGAYATYHLTKVDHVVKQITRHVLDEFSNRNFENELERVARNLDVVVTMGTDRDRRTKRVLGVTEVIWDEEKKEARTVDLVRYSEITREYYYSSNISKDLLYLMAQENLEEAKILIQLLKKREKESPMSDLDRIKDTLLDDLLGGESVV
ncbi:ATPase, T2SS/T4P/T4SS family [Halobacillus litoralis]|uniref:Secretion system protein E n=1 Tax=Halobacillus litoralis TaxID=45668 RepID=A0A410MJE2_9BACI|nr:ATPase, T2SS/T4P/T4SS family [Halobacillus litoralis]QAS54821.1 secretion system protein E [Halobacillus litoralis]